MDSGCHSNSSPRIGHPKRCDDKIHAAPKRWEGEPESVKNHFSTCPTISVKMQHKTNLNAIHTKRFQEKYCSPFLFLAIRAP
jgi:hypothetical protein